MADFSDTVPDGWWEDVAVPDAAAWALALGRGSTEIVEPSIAAMIGTAVVVGTLLVYSWMKRGK